MGELCIIVLLFFFSSGAFSSDGNYVGGKVCAACHQQEYQQWTESHHDLAMQEATEKTVLGDFNNVQSKHFGIETSFFRKDKLFMVRTDGPDGKLVEYPIKFTFGFYPLQQYLIEFPGGRLQTLDIAWDSRPKDRGGQRWMHLHPGEKIAHDDVLHWTGPNLNWNYMCADCHSTNLQKNYDAETETYNTTWSELNVSCEACHGPGEKHLNWAQSKAEQRASQPNKGLDVLFNNRQDAHWIIDSKSGIPKRSKANKHNTEVEVCARCHSRRSQIANDDISKPLMDAYLPALLTEGLYHADGQIQDEVYVYGSFLQSKMYQHGVTCSDCHNPHSNALKQPGEQVCYQCHNAKQYASNSHHFHDDQSTGASCVECHMPATTYMQVDARHDHSFRIPRPDLSVKLGTPNACTNCHDQKTAQWAADTVQQWYGAQAKGYQQYAETFSNARKQKLNANTQLQKLANQSFQATIARATAMQELQAYPEQGTLAAIEKILKDENPLLRRSALVALRNFDLRNQVPLAFPLLDDPILAVRIEAISLLIQIPAGQLSPAQAALFQKAIDESIQVQKFNAERPEAQVNLAGIYVALGLNSQATLAYKKALKLQPQFVPAYINFAQMVSSQRNEVEAEALLRKGLKKVPDSPDLAEALGLSLIRQQKKADALPWLAKAIQQAPDNIRYGYIYAVALNSAGQPEKAINQLDSIHQRYPGNTEILFALVTFNRDVKRPKEALVYINKLQILMPENKMLKKLQESLTLSK